MVIMARKTDKKNADIVPSQAEVPVQTGTFDFDNSFDIGVVKPEYLRPVTIELSSTPIKFIVDFGSFLTHDYFVNKEVKLIQLSKETNEKMTFLEKRFKATIDYFVQNALIGWEGAKQGGVDVQFDKQTALDYFKNRPNIYTELEAKCSTILIELTQKRDDDLKN